MCVLNFLESSQRPSMPVNEKLLSVRPPPSGGDAAASSAPASSGPPVGWSVEIPVGRDVDGPSDGPSADGPDQAHFVRHECPVRGTVVGNEQQQRGAYNRLADTARVRAVREQLVHFGVAEAKRDVAFTRRAFQKIGAAPANSVAKGRHIVQELLGLLEGDSEGAVLDDMEGSELGNIEGTRLGTIEGLVDGEETGRSEGRSEGLPDKE
eukprot:CAMPEP_0194301294 /NCGR_PEP_ID=MMETSP0169-20130528/61716_1 /TAXON_ID=218684 /ORGANISM="Corethron pennatum, Strain L29A3" /LENGTH=208 /DNA_ID=CAMNT_0039051525 /DNA_START=148 /DNA_END=776 /DNA_ORIENTATION=-